jgi:20S proteasome alpha/beta subunit
MPPKLPSLGKWQPPARWAVTIIAGFKAPEGIVICADTQETQEPMKRHVKKVRVEPKFAHIRRIMGGVDVAAAFCGAGPGPFIDMLIDKAWKQASQTRTLNETCEAIEEEIKRIYREYGEIFQPGSMPFAEILYGVKAEGESRLFLASGPVVVEKAEYETSGIGSDLANYLIGRMYGSSLNLYQCVILAAFVLLQTKNHVEGCGGQSHIAVLRNDGASGMVEDRRVEAITGLLESTDISAGRLLLHAGDLSKDGETLKRSIQEFFESVVTSRALAAQSIGRADEFWNLIMNSFGGQEMQFRRDLFGFMETDSSSDDPTQSDAQTLGDQR